MHQRTDQTDVDQRMQEMKLAEKAIEELIYQCSILIFLNDNPNLNLPQSRINVITRIRNLITKGYSDV